MNHITGGGFYENIPRGLPDGLAAKIYTQAFPTPKVFDWLQQQANIERMKCTMSLIWVLVSQP